MADDADIAQDYEERERQSAIASAAKPLAKGKPGECSECGEHSPRLVGRLCVACREERLFRAKV